MISDIHSNLHALRAVLEATRRSGADAMICAGDLVGYGPHPNECVETIAELGVMCVAGNHDRMAAGLQPLERHGRLIRESQEWTRAELRPDTRAYLAALPAMLAVGKLVVAHGTLDDPNAYVVSSAQGAAQLAQLARDHPLAIALVLGHTHNRWIYADESGPTSIPLGGRVQLTAGRRYLLNPGSVGQSRQWEFRPRARFMLFDLDLGCVESHAIDYDVDSCRSALRKQGLPSYSVHLPPGAVARASRFLLEAGRA